MSNKKRTILQSRNMMNFTTYKLTSTTFSTKIVIKMMSSLKHSGNL